MGAAVLGATTSAVSAAVNGGNILQAAVFGAISGAAFHGVGRAFDANANGIFSNLKGSAKFFAQSGAHGITGGVLSVLQGGKFGHGFATSGIAKAITFGGNAIGTGAEVQFITAAIAGGTVSEITGGKFANGAGTSALAYLVNELSTKGRDSNAQEGSTTNDSGVEQNLPDPKPSWVTRLKTFFGLQGGKPGNVAAGVGSTLVTTGIKALDTDVAAGVASISIRKNLNLCEGAGNCWVPDDDISIRGYLGEDPPNYKGVGDLFIRREWDFIPLTEQVKDL